MTRYTAQLLFFILFWAYRGVEVDLFYQAQAYIFGDNHEPVTILKKVMFDQLIYAALWAAPTIAIAYLWKESGFNFALLKQRLTKRFMLNDVPVVIATNWLIWTPAVAVIYAMPADLQVPLFNLVLCFFLLMVAHISKRN